MQRSRLTYPEMPKPNWLNQKWWTCNPCKLLASSILTSCCIFSTVQPVRSQGLISSNSSEKQKCQPESFELVQGSVQAIAQPNCDSPPSNVTSSLVQISAASASPALKVDPTPEAPSVVWLIVMPAIPVIGGTAIFLYRQWFHPKPCTSEKPSPDATSHSCQSHPSPSDQSENMPSQEREP